MVAFLTPVDIGNRAAQHCGAEMMDATLGFSEVSKTARQISFVYDKVRRAELRRNTWRFATRRQILRPIDTNTMQLAPALWSAGSTYFFGSVVADSSGNLWTSRLPSNLGNQPGIVWTAWEPYYGPMTVTLYDGTGDTTYSVGEVVYTAPGDGTYNVYISLTNGNALDPSLPDQWSATTTYFQNQVVQVFPAWASGTTYSTGQGVQYTDGNWYASLVAGNVGNIPPATSSKWALMPVEVLTSLVPGDGSQTSPTTSPIVEWVNTTAYGLGSFVLFNGNQYVSLAASNTGNLPSAGAPWWAQITLGTLYMSLVDLNIGNAPASSPTKWTTTFTQGGGNSQWVQIGGAAAPGGVALAQLNIIYPAGAGPASQSTTRNVYQLPNGYLRTAPRDPKGGAVGYLGVPANIWLDDWVYEKNYIVTSDSSPIMVRFVADVADVSTMDDMFCEGLALTIALEVVEALTQSTAKKTMIAQEYKVRMGEARTVNAIEIGYEEPPLDEWLQVRW
jgi:hypothetical protein